MDQVLAKWDALQKAWNGNKLDKVGPILDEIKIALTVVSPSFLPLATSSASGNDGDRCPVQRPQGRHRSIRAIHGQTEDVLHRLCRVAARVCQDVRVVGPQPAL